MKVERIGDGNDNSYKGSSDSICMSINRNRNSRSGSNRNSIDNNNS